MMLENQTITFIGGGHITEIIIQNLTHRAVMPPQQIIVSDPSMSRCQHLVNRFGITIAANNVVAAQRGKLILVCVRPEVVKDIMPDLLEADLNLGQVVISVAAGVPLRAYAALGVGHPLVRALPNPPSQVGQGIAPLVFTSGVTKSQRQQVMALFTALGDWIEVDESYLNAITSLSSPVATYLFFQSLIDAGVACDLPLPVATQIAAQTIAGSMAVWRANQVSPSELIRQASTPGGVSVKTIETLKELGFKPAVMKAILDGATRAAELGKKQS
jgi:pyrroline-5-carboxylate reductase